MDFFLCLLAIIVEQRNCRKAFFPVQKFFCHFPVLVPNQLYLAGVDSNDGKGLKEELQKSYEIVFSVNVLKKHLKSKVTKAQALKKVMLSYTLFLLFTFDFYVTKFILEPFISLLPRFLSPF